MSNSNIGGFKMPKRIFFLIPLILSFVLFAKSADKSSDIPSITEPALDNRISNIELNRSVYTEYVPGDETKNYKEIRYAKKLYQSGDHIKAKGILKMLKRGNNRPLSEQAHYLCMKWYNNLFIPIDAVDNTEYVVDTKELDNFKRKFPRSKYIGELEYVFKKDLSIFNSNVRRSKNSKKVDLIENCPIRYRNDSTYVCSFHTKYKTKDGNEHNLVIKVSGKINKYEPWANLHNESGSKGLLIDDDSRISIKIDNNEKIIIKDYVEYEQIPEYEIKKIVEFGMESEKRSITEINAVNTTQLATYLTDKLIMPNFKVQFVYGKMNELIPEKIEDTEDIINDRFNSKCIVELKLNEFDK